MGGCLSPSREANPKRAKDAKQPRSRILSTARKREFAQGCGAMDAIGFHGLSRHHFSTIGRVSSSRGLSAKVGFYRLATPPIVDTSGREKLGTLTTPRCSAAR